MVISVVMQMQLIIFDKSCVTKVGTNKYDEEAAKKVTRLVKEFFTTTLKK